MALGDLSKKITLDVKGEILELKNTINTMVDQLSTFAAEVTRVALEVGTEGKLGGQAQVKGVAGTWKHLTDNVNTMAANLTGMFSLSLLVFFLCLILILFVYSHFSSMICVLIYLLQAKYVPLLK